MADLGGFNANEVKPNEGFDVIPAGEYDAVIVNSKVEPTKKGDGKMLKLELQVLNGTFQNRKLFDQLNIWNPNAQAVQIAKGQLSAICRAVNVLTPKDSAELHGKPLRIKVTVAKSDEYGDQNRIKAYKPRQAGPVPAPPAEIPVAAGSGQPW